MTPIFRKGKKEDPWNYRLVNVTSIPRKVMKQLIQTYISRYIKDKKIVRSSQHGSRKGKSCLTDLINFCDEVTGLVGEGRVAAVVYVDFGRAFDSVSHTFLIE